MGNYISDQKNSRFFGLKLSRNTDADIIQHLETQESIQAYLKDLIREDMKRRNSTMKTYKIRHEYLDLWLGSESSDPDTIITQEDLERLAADWDKPVEELLEQLIPQE